MSIFARKLGVAPVRSLRPRKAWNIVSNPGPSVVDQWFQKFSLAKSIAFWLPIIVFVVYISVGALRCYSALHRMKPPAFEKWLDWWWMLIFG